MASVFLTTTHPHPVGTLEHLLTLVPKDGHRVHTLVDNPEAAEVVLFVESLDTWPSMLHARRHPIVRRFREKTFGYCEMDMTIPFLPGVYPAIPRRFFSPSRHRTWSYIAMFANPYIGPGELPLLGLPSAARKASTMGWMDAGFVSPPAAKRTGAADAGTGDSARIRANAASGVRGVRYDMGFSGIQMER